MIFMEAVSVEGLGFHRMEERLDECIVGHLPWPIHALRDAQLGKFGELAAGFNRMADEVQQVYTTLEQRVSEKTLDLAQKNREL